ncbi:MAG: hypothetical protein HQL84_13235 [Magnetococcales bacterium]|nr:hypothetical protein [Magnetococcales bacterium]MBF0150997.1 hypothetical protein [Magnetococcales bacterium]MBF0172695.1 hypothetical protein [Magnetococcales bacterium]MBF0347892.1 hypothetical protein [Magnetococcales bacterium]MBF0629409.1 hypothetical protein [Magnetococcales bacterium]
MKKSLILGLAAVAAAWTSYADAGEVKLGGQYMGRWQMYDANMIDEVAPSDRGEAYVHELMLSTDMIASEKSHAHMRVQVLDSAVIEGADLGSVSSDTGAAGGVSNTQVSNVVNLADPWEIRQMWLETEAWGIGVKFGEMPITLNDTILVGDDLSSNGGLLLSKTFGNVTAVVGNIRINEDMSTGASSGNDAGKGADSDDANLWAMSLFGKAGLADYNFTLAYADLQEASDFMEVLETVCGATTPCATTDGSNIWAALTLSGKLGYVNAVGTVIYEDGYDLSQDTTGSKISNLWSSSGILGALRLNGSTGFGEWNAYGFVASEDFNNITNDNMVWSATWDQGGPNGIDLMNNFAVGAGTNTSPSENMTGIGVGLKVKAAGWTINPMIDYAEVTEAQAGGTWDSATGGSLLLSTDIQKDTTLSLEAAVVSPEGINRTNEDNAFYAQAGIKMIF